MVSQRLLLVHRLAAHFLAAGDQTQGRFALIDALARKGNCQPRHIHRNEDESFYILEGEITAWIGDQTIRAAQPAR